MRARAAAKRAVYGAVAASGLGAPVGAEYTRFGMYARLRATVREITGGTDGAGRSLLDISGSRRLIEEVGLGAADITEAHYPEHNILSLPMADASFDFVVSDQVLEHIEGDPFVAFRETARVTRPGGLLIHTTCFLNEIHLAPDDFWRFTPAALRLLCRGVAEPIEVGGAGGLLSVPVSWLGLRRAPVPAARWHPLHAAALRNNPRWPVMTWVVATRTG